ncbi:DUF2948 family protein [Ensifer sp. IC3342]|nr:DUF2948 family protein [Ensifer sp. BRP08]MCA1445854.1 DUF2948 family protein [Ensifer sp. IC3342]
MDALKLLALDEEDLGVVSAHVQDAVFKVAGISYDARRGQLFLVINRFVWENADGKRRSFERRRAVLSFKRVVAVRSLGFDRGNAEAVLDLLALRFSIKGEGPEGSIELVLAGEAAIVLDVECIEVQLADTGGAWETAFRPRHPEGA